MTGCRVTPNELPGSARPVTELGYRGTSTMIRDPHGSCVYALGRRIHEWQLELAVVAELPLAGICFALSRPPG